jgi:hypothetical protein
MVNPLGGITGITAEHRAGVLSFHTVSSVMLVRLCFMYCRIRPHPEHCIYDCCRKEMIFEMSKKDPSPPQIP